jgi:2-(1,2-epoxy-1,2-dihydrophenyl)acetyl-CoA isomerase
MTHDTIIVEKENCIAILTLNRPDRLNAWTQQMAEETLEALDDMCRDDNVAVVIVTGAGRAFSSGADASRLNKIVENPNDPEILMNMVKRSSSITVVAVRLRSMEKPVIAAVNGIAAGGGFGIAMACDIRIASEEARFSQLFVRRGLVPDTGSTYFMPRLVGASKSLELMWTGDIIDAGEAERIGLVNRVVKAEELMEETKTLAQRIASGPRVAVQLTKRALYRGMLETDLQDQVDYELYLNALCFGTDDFKEGVRSFMEKRKPLFKN